MAPVTKNHLPPTTYHLPLVVIVGPTASGKTNLAVTLAEKYGGEIICADSRTIYRGLDIGTAKPTDNEQKRVKHWGLDLANPGDRFTAADFKQYALSAIDDIRSRGKVPFLVGGSGLYVDGVVLDYKFNLTSSLDSRGKYESMSISELHDYCKNNNIILPENLYNKRYVIRAIESKGLNTSKRNTPIDNTIVVGITIDKESLRRKIKQRTEEMLDDGVIQEAKKMSKIYGWESESMTGNVYRVIFEHLKYSTDFEELKTKVETLDWRLAKRQLTWFKRNSFIKWKNLYDAEVYIGDILAK